MSTTRTGGVAVGRGDLWVEVTPAEAADEPCACPNLDAVAPRVDLVETSNTAPTREAFTMGPPTAVDWPGRALGIVDGADAASVAAEWYGDPALAGLVVETPDGFGVRPAALAPAARARYDAALTATVAALLERAHATGAPAAEVLRRGFSALSHPTAQDTLLVGLSVARGATPGAVLDAALRAGDPAAGALLASRWAAEARFGPVSTATAERVEGFALAALADDRGDALAALLTALPGPEQVTLLRRIAAQHGQMSTPMTARFAEPTPAHMLYRAFEALPEGARGEVLEGLEEVGAIDRRARAALFEGRPAAGRAAPMLTYGAQLAAMDYAKWSEDSSWAWLGGGLASLATPELAGTTALTLGTAGLFGGSWAAGVAARSPTAARAVAGVASAAGLVPSAGDLDAAVSGTDPSTGRPLLPAERLARLVGGASGLILSASGLAFSFSGGRVTTARVSPEELHQLHRTHVRVMIHEGVEVFVPRGSPASAAAPGPASPTALAPGPEVAMAEVRQLAASMAGSKVGALMRPYAFGAQSEAVKAGLTAHAHLKAQTLYLDARGQGLDHAAARKQVSRELPRSMRAFAARFAQEAVRVEVEARIEDGTIFDRSRMSAAAAKQLAAYEAGEIGQRTRALARRLAGRTEAEVRARLQSEVSAGRATVKEARLSQPKSQVMTVWELEDGGVVRLKPLGDARRDSPTASVEMRTDPRRSDSGQSGIAFKVRSDGSAVPSAPYAVASDGFVGEQLELVVSVVMDAGHWQVAR